MSLGFLADYRVKRGKKESSSTIDGEQLAVGADAVNKKIVEILGFELEVFDVVCAANQKESERLTRLTPAKRKELIDDVVGLTRRRRSRRRARTRPSSARRGRGADPRARATGRTGEARALQAVHEIKLELNETVSVLAQRVKLQRIIDAVGKAPAKPVERGAPTSRHSRRTRSSACSARRSARSSNASCPTSLKPGQRAAARRRRGHQRVRGELARRGTGHSTAKSVSCRSWLEVWDQKALLDYDTVHCPKCQHEFLPSDPDIELAAIEALPTLRSRRKRSRADLRRHDSWPDDLKSSRTEAPLDPREIVMPASLWLERTDQGEPPA
jgi:exonuclease SbcC